MRALRIRCGGGVSEFAGGGVWRSRMGSGEMAEVGAGPGGLGGQGCEERWNGKGERQRSVSGYRGASLGRDNRVANMGPTSASVGSGVGADYCMGRPRRVDAPDIPRLAVRTQGSTQDGPPTQHASRGLARHLRLARPYREPAHRRPPHLPLSLARPSSSQQSAPRIVWT